MLGVMPYTRPPAPLSDSANCVVPVTRSLALNHPNRRPLIIRGAIKEANVAYGLRAGPPSRFSLPGVPTDSPLPGSLLFPSPRSFFPSILRPCITLSDLTRGI